jgi:hypothetical protein
VSAKYPIWVMVVRTLPHQKWDVGEPEGEGEEHAESRHAVCLSLGLIAVWTAPANAASTRAEYIAQVEPMCRANLGPRQQTFAGEVRAFKKWARLSNKGTLKAWVNQTHKFARALERHVQVHNTLTDQISAVPPPPEDTQLVANWLMLRNEYERLTQSAAQALHAFAHQAVEQTECARE